MSFQYSVVVHSKIQAIGNNERYIQIIIQYTYIIYTYKDIRNIYMLIFSCLYFSFCIQTRLH